MVQKYESSNADVREVKPLKTSLGNLDKCKEEICHHTIQTTSIVSVFSKSKLTLDLF